MHEPAPPLYHQVYRRLREQIFNGPLHVGERLPAEDELALRFKVSRITLRHALRLLADEGLIARRQGRGTFVAGATRPMIASLHATAPVRAAANIGASTRVRLISAGDVRATAQVAQLLALDVGTRVRKVVRLRLHGDAPVALITTYVPADIGRRIDREALERATVLEHIQAAGFEPAFAEHAISAVPADDLAARHLTVRRGDALLAERRTVFTRSWRPIELLVSACRPDRYEFRVSLTLTDAPDVGPRGADDVGDIIRNETLLRETIDRPARLERTTR
ncbi:MAG: GntR family transcriptional regulator [Alphaproteobacteria bacterium]|nr:GntR family transcriptional regulator [Alphaproteobacteria bacterium]